MAEHQGAAEVKCRKNSIFVAADSVVMGWIDEHGVLRGMKLTDWDAYAEVIPSDVDVQCLGSALRSALLASRIGMSGNWADAQLARGDYDVRLARAFGLSSSKNLYPGVLNIFVAWEGGQISLSPSRRRGGGAFEAFPIEKGGQHQDIVMPFESSDDDLGTAVKVCLARCL